MSDSEEQERQTAIRRCLAGENPAAIWSSLGRSKRWFYKWLKRYRMGDQCWFREMSRRPVHNPSQTEEEIQKAVGTLRAELDAEGVFCGAQAILWRMEELHVRPLPSIRTVGRILDRHELIRRARGRYQPKGKPYPALIAHRPGDVHQADFVGPCYLQGPIRFYSLNMVDLATARCATEPLTAGKQGILRAFWAIWTRLGLPRYQQVDNEMVFYGSPAHPRGMGNLIRLCLPLGVEPVFIPMREPWRNGVVEKFNDHWQSKFLRRVRIDSREGLQRESLAFEARHNSRYRYSKLGGKTPLEALAASRKPLRFPTTESPGQGPLPKPTRGRYHVVRFIRSDRVLNLFSEKFTMPPEAQYEYVQATIDVGKQKLIVRVGKTIVEEIRYDLR